MRQETKDFLIGGGPKLKRHEIFSWDTRFSHETGDRRFFHWGGALYWKPIRFSPGSWDFLMRQETRDFLGGEGDQILKKHEIFTWHQRFSCETWDRRFSHEGGPKMIKYEIFSWDMRFSHETGDRRFSHWGGPKTEKTWDFLFEHEIFSWDKRQEIFLLGGAKNW